MANLAFSWVYWLNYLGLYASRQDRATGQPDELRYEPVGPLPVLWVMRDCFPAMDTRVSLPAPASWRNPSVLWRQGLTGAQAKLIQVLPNRYVPVCRHHRGTRPAHVTQCASISKAWTYVLTTATYEQSIANPAHGFEADLPARGIASCIIAKNSVDQRTTQD